MASKTPNIQSIDRNSMRPIIAKRFVSARKIAGMSQLAAAAMLGYRNSSPLCKIEFGTAVPSPDMIARAAILYSVSADYLMGLSDFPERDGATIEQLAVMRSVREQVAHFVSDTTRKIVGASGDTAALAAHLDTLQRAVGEIWRQVCALPPAKKGAPPLIPPETRAAIEFAVEGAEASFSYLRRRHLLKAHEYFDEVTPESQYPLLLIMEAGQLGKIDAQAQVTREADAVQPQLFEQP